MTKFESLTALLVAVVSLLGYAVTLLRRIRRVLARFEQFGREHRLLLDAAHGHEKEKIVAAAPRRSHRRPNNDPYLEGGDYSRWAGPR
jgi:hypothetical protein